MKKLTNTELSKKIEIIKQGYNEHGDAFKLLVMVQERLLSIPIEPPVKPEKNVKDYEWLNNKLDDILGEFEHKRTTKEGAKDKLFEFIFEDLVNEIQKLKDSSLSV